MRTLSADEKIESIIGKQKIFIKTTKDETKNWFQDYFFIGFEKQNYHNKEIIGILEKSSALSLKNPIWKNLSIENEDMLLLSSDIDSHTKLDNEESFEQFLQENINNPQYKDKFVAFVNGTFQDVDEVENRLVKKMHEKFGNVEMFVGKVTSETDSHIIDTPELG